MATSHELTNANSDSHANPAIPHFHLLPKSKTIEADSLSSLRSQRKHTVGLACSEIASFCKCFWSLPGDPFVCITTAMCEKQVVQRLFLLRRSTVRERLSHPQADMTRPEQHYVTTKKTFTLSAFSLFLASLFFSYLVFVPLFIPVLGISVHLCSLHFCSYLFICEEEG